MKRKFVLLMFFMFFIFSLFICFAQSSSNDQRIVGTWINMNDYGTITLVFNANGSGLIKFIFTKEAKRTLGVSDTEESFTYGISITGLLTSTSDTINGYTPYFSPDGRTMILAEIVYQKR